MLRPIERASVVAAAAFSSLLGCSRSETSTSADNTPTSAAVPARELRDTPPSSNLEQLGAELAAVRACDRVRGQFRALPGIEGAGTLWVQDCVAIVNGQLATFSLSGYAWLASGTAREAAEVTLQMSGALDVRYDTTRLVLRISFEPDATASFMAIPLTRQVRDLERTVVAAMANALAAPGGAPQANAAQLDPRRGVTTSIDVCSGLPQFTFGTERADAVDSSQMLELHIESPSLFGPLPEHWRAIDVRVGQGAVRVSTICESDARLLAAAYVHGRSLPRLERSHTRVVRRARRIELPERKCERTLFLQPYRSTTASASWSVPAAQGGAARLRPLRCAVQDVEPRFVPRRGGR